MLEKRIAERIKEELGVDAKVEEVTIKKNNGVEKYGFCIRLEEEKCSPTIYVDQKLDDDEKVDFIVNAYKKEFSNIPEMNKRNGNIINMLTNADDVYKSVIPTLVSNSNADDLDEQGVYHQPYLNMEIVYRVILNVAIDGCYGSVKLTDALIERANIDKNVLHEKAMENMKNMTVIQNLLEILPVPDCGMYVVRNNKELYGASSIMCEDTLMEMHERTGSDTIFVLPSSIHEVLVVGNNVLDEDNEEEKIQELKEMMKSINATEVSPDEVLTDNVYIHRRDGRMEVA